MKICILNIFLNSKSRVLVVIAGCMHVLLVIQTDFIIQTRTGVPYVQLLQFATFFENLQITISDFNTGVQNGYFKCIKHFDEIQC